MRDRQVLTVDTEYARREAQRVANKVSSFIVAREESILSKLLALSDVSQGRAFEVQVKVQLSADDLSSVEDAIESGLLAVVRSSVRRQYDAYLILDDVDHSRIRYREDEVLSSDGEHVESVEYRLTLTGSIREREYDNLVILSQSRYDAPATHSLRFYKEYFDPAQTVEVSKRRRRYHIRFGGTAFALNIDQIIQPSWSTHFLEIKSRTWSSQDAERKAALIGELLHSLALTHMQPVKEEYPDLVLGRVVGAPDSRNES